MKTRLLALLMLGLAALPAPAQERERFWSDPAIPPREALERLNLELAWRVDVPMDGRRDGFVSIQHTGRQILTQTRAGVVALYDAETGRSIWRVRVGEPYRPAAAPAFNSTTVFVINGTTLFALDRSNGTAQWQLTLGAGLSAQPAADEEQVYIFAATGNAYAYRPVTVEVPVEELGTDYAPLDLAQLRKEERTVQVVRPLRQWSYPTLLRLDLPAVQTSEMLLVPGPDGTLLGLVKFPVNAGLVDAFRFRLDAGLLAGPGSFDTVAYCPGRDGFLYAFEMNKGRLVWRQLVGMSALTRTPVANEQDVFVVSERHGMSRLDRETGTPLWRIPNGDRLLNSQAEADRFLASSPKFVYAADKAGRLVILDRGRGLVLSRLDVRDYVVPVVNEQTDRLYLAANNGLILCLRDRDYPDPQRQRKISKREADAGKTLPERIKDMKRRLAEPVTLEPSDPQPLSQFLEEVRKNYGVKSFVSKKSFQEIQNQPEPGELKVKVPKLDKVPLGDAIRKVLEPINATYDEIGEQIFIIPKKKGGPGGMPPEKQPGM